MKKFLVLVCSAALSVSLLAGCGNSSASKDVEPEKEDVVVEVNEEEENADFEGEAEEYFYLMKDMYEANTEFNDAIVMLVDLLSDVEVLAEMSDEELEELGAVYDEMIVAKEEAINELSQLELTNPELQDLHDQLVLLFTLELEALNVFLEGLAEEDFEKADDALVLIEQLMVASDQLAEIFQ